jgi:ferritin-like metal-binding protein YciE
MQGTRVTVVQEAGQFLPFGVLALHGSFKQGLLNIARHVAPDIHSRPSQQAREAFQSVSHGPSEIAVVHKGTAKLASAFHCHHCQKEARMGLFTKDIKTMEDLLLHGLQDIYYAEQQIIKSLPKMIENATNRDLVAGLKGHLEETNKQVERLQKAFEKLGKEPSGTSCPAIDGIIKEADETAGEIEDKTVLDAAIVANAQAVEHYEICRYGTLIAWAEELGHDEIVRFLTTNLNEEKAANTKLNTVALRKGVNAKASTAA